MTQLQQLPPPGRSGISEAMSPTVSHCSHTTTVLGGFYYLCLSEVQVELGRGYGWAGALQLGHPLS